MDPVVISEFLASTRAFQGLDAGLLDKLADRVECRAYEGSATILRTGSPASFFGVIFNGRASMRMVNAMTGVAVVQQELQVGEHFGELAAVLQTAQPYEVVAETATTILAVPENVFDHLMGKIAPFSLALAKSMASRLVRASLKTVSSSKPPAREIQPAAVEPVAAVEEAPDGVMPFVRTANFDINDQVIEMVPVELMLQHRFIPLALNGKCLKIGMVDPFHSGAVADLDRVLHGIQIDTVAIAYDDFMSCVARMRLDGDARRGKRGASGAIVFEKDDQLREAEQKLGVVGHEVVELVEKIIRAGVALEASDIHIEEGRKEVKVRFRVSGVMQDWQEYIPGSFGRGIMARFKILAGLDITERRRPQDGRIGMRLGKRELDFRISVLPAMVGEKIVTRMFDASSMMRPLEQVFADKMTLKALREALMRPFGALIVAGPTGSGKSSTLYACLHELMTTRRDLNICVVEDPVEFRLKGVTQVQVSHSVGLTFATALRSLMRQDPDVIMVGEIRDSETASIALEAAMTGHKMLSSFHANNALAAIQRLENLGSSRTVVAQSVSLILVQRLVRRVCRHCVVLAEPAPALRESLAERGIIEKGSSQPLPKPRGCDHCHQSGFDGRIAVVESLKVTDDVAAELMAGERLDNVQKNAEKNGSMVTFRRYAAMLMARKLIAPGDALLTVAG